MTPVTVPGDYPYFIDAAKGVTIPKAKQIVQILNAYGMPYSTICLEGIGTYAVLLTLEEFNAAFAGQVNDTDKYRAFICMGIHDDEGPRYMLQPQNCGNLLSTLKAKPDVGDALEIIKMFLDAQPEVPGVQKMTALEVLAFNSAASKLLADKVAADWALLKS